MHDAEQLNAVFDGAIENEVVADWKTAEICGEFLDTAAHVWRGGDDAQSSVKLLNKPVGRRKVSYRNVAPDFVVIAPRLSRAEDARHD